MSCFKTKMRQSILILKQKLPRAGKNLLEKVLKEALIKDLLGFSGGKPFWS